MENENETLPIEEVKTEEHEEVQAKKTDKGLEFVPTAPEYRGEIEVCAWEKYNSDKKVIGYMVQIGGKNGIRFKLNRCFIPRD